MSVVVKIGRKQILNEAEALETDVSAAPPSASKYGGARAGSRGLYYVGKQRGGEAEDEAEKKIIAGINSLEYSDSLVNLLNKSNIGLSDEQWKKLEAFMIDAAEEEDIALEEKQVGLVGDRAEIRRIFTQDTVGELVALIRSFQLGADKEKEFAKLLNFWGRLNTVKFEPPPKSRAAAPVEEPAEEPGEETEEETGGPEETGPADPRGALIAKVLSAVIGRLVKQQLGERLEGWCMALAVPGVIKGITGLDVCEWIIESGIDLIMNFVTDSLSELETIQTADAAIQKIVGPSNVKMLEAAKTADQIRAVVEGIPVMRLLAGTIAAADDNLLGTTAYDALQKLKNISLNNLIPNPKDMKQGEKRYGQDAETWANLRKKVRGVPVVSKFILDTKIGEMLVNWIVNYAEEGEGEEETKGKEEKTSPVEEPKPAPVSGLSPTLVPDTEEYQESRTWQEDRLLYSEQVANELLRRTIKA